VAGRATFRGLELKDDVVVETKRTKTRANLQGSWNAHQLSFGLERGEKRGRDRTSFILGLWKKGVLRLEDSSAIKRHGVLKKPNPDQRKNQILLKEKIRKG